jgi:TonB-linked SusC/RagA family outer membrane protein
MGLSYHGENGFYKHTNTNPKYSSQIKNKEIRLLSKGSLQATNSTTVSANLNFMIRDQNHPIDFKVIRNAYSIPSNAFPVKNKDGSWGGTNIFNNNPVAQLESTGFADNIQRFFTFIGKVNQQLGHLVDGLSATVKVGYYNGVNAHENATKGFAYEEVSPVLDSNGNITGTNVSHLGKKTPLTPQRNIFNLHTINSEFEGRLNYSNSFKSSKFDSFIFYRQDSKSLDVGNNTFRWQTLGGNFHYGIDNTYFLDFAFSYAGSNRIHQLKNRWGFFPAVSGAWLISNEPFLTNNNSINELKLRASWGQAGNGLIPIRTTTKNRFGGGGNYRFGVDNRFFQGFQENQLRALNKKFEKSTEVNFGIDTKFFGKLILSGNIYFSKRRNILVNPSGTISNVLGVGVEPSPDGIVKNNGYEFKIGWEDHTGKFRYSLIGRMSYAKNTIINNDEAFVPYPYLKTEGRSLGQIFGLVSEGFFMNEKEIKQSSEQTFGVVKPGDIKYKDLNGDHIINQYDRKPIGYSQFPREYFSATLRLGYKGFNFTTVFQGVGKRSVLLTGTQVYWPLINNGNMSTWYTNFWTLNNKKSAKLPRLTTQSNANDFRNSTLWLRNGSFIKIRYVELSYSFRADLISKFNLNKLVLFLRGRNIYSFGHIGYADPENIQSNWTTLRFYNIGLKIKF